jgi:hypothetical protein
MTSSKLIRRAAVLAPAVILCAVALVPAEPPPDKGDVQAGPYRISGPYTHENLSIFLIHGEDKVKGKSFLTLQEALEQKKVVVHETQNVNELSVENVSPTEEVFIQAGDIVKGGQQDRVLSFDLIVPSKSGKMPIASFCVEHGRWTQRGAENVMQFGASTEQLSTKDLKLAARGDGKTGEKQREVWDKVAKAQMLLKDKVGAPVQAAESASSLQLTLEHKKLKEALEEYLKKLSPIVEDKKDVIGYAFAINGKVNSADIYGSSTLFKKLWPKLIKASAVEAVVEVQKDKKFEPVAATAIKGFLEDAEKGKAREKEVTKRVQEIQRETDKSVMFECRDKDAKGAVRQSYIAK